MANDDRVRWEASFKDLDEYLARTVARLDEQVAKAEALGDEALSTRLKAQRAELIASGADVEEVNRVTKALEEEAAAIQRNIDLNLKNLETLRLTAEQQTALKRLNEEPAANSLAAQRTKALEEQAAAESLAAQRAQALAAQAAPREPSVILPTGVGKNRYTAVGETAGGQVAAETRAEEQARRRALLVEQAQAEEDAKRIAQAERMAALLHQQNLEQGAANAHATGYDAGAAGKLLSPTTRAGLLVPPKGDEWTAAERGLVRYEASMGEYAGLSSRMDTSTRTMSANLTRLGVAESQASNELRRHGALTTEFISALARGETTISEVGYQVGATIGKFAGWATAAAATYAALGAVVEFGKGAIDTASGVQQLTRTIDNLDRGKASRAIQGLSEATNVPIKEASDTIFQFSRTFHNLEDATTAAGLALAAYKLDGVSVSDTVKAATAIHQQFGISATGLIPVFDELAQGQQRFNARITEQIPLLQRAAGAVKNAGGDLTQFLQLSTVALRTTQLSGSQLGTIFQRAASNYLNPTTATGRRGLADVSQITGIDATAVVKGPGGFTELMRELLKASATLTNEQRSQLAHDFAGSGLGGRAASLFGGGGAALLPQVEKEVNARASKGVLGTELEKELRTVRERMTSFVNGLQRLGASFADTGVINGFGFAIHGVTKTFDGLRQVVNVFDELPGGIKSALEALVAFRLAMLFVSRTRFGAALPGITNVPGFRPSQDTLDRRELAIGSRSALSSVEDDLAKTTQRGRVIGAQQLTAAKQRDAIEKEINAAGVASQEQLDRRNVIEARINELDSQGNKLEAERNAQLEVQASLKKQVVGLTAISRNQRYTPEQTAALKAAVTGTASTAAVAGEEAATTADTTAQARLAALKQRMARLLRLNSAASAEAAAAMATEATAATAATAEAAVAETEVTASAGRLAGLGAGLRGMVAALDPLTIALLGLPFAIEGFSKLIDAVNKTDSANIRKLDPHNITSITSLNQAVATANQSVNSGPRFGEDVDQFIARVKGAQALKNLRGAIDQARQHTLASPVQQVDYSIAELTKEADADSKAFIKGAITKREYERRMQELQRSSRGSLDVQFAKSNNDANGTIVGFISLIKDKLGASLAATAKNTKDYFDALGHLSDKQLTQRVQGYSDRGEVFGLNKSDLQKAGETYLYLAAKYRASNDPAGLQLVKTAQQAFLTAVNKNVTDLLKEAESAQSFGAAQRDLGGAVNDINRTKTQVSGWVRAMSEHFRKYPAIIKAARDAAAQIDAQLNDQLKSAIDAQLQDIKTQSDLRASRIQGFSPEADLARAQETLTGLRQELAKAKADHASWQQLADLQTQIDNQALSVAKQRIDNARTLLDAQNQLATASIIGTGPEADIARARSDVAGAQRVLAFDQKNGAGQAKIIADQAAVDSAMNGLISQQQSQNQALHQSLAAYIQSKAALAESQTTDPVRQGQIQLNADIAAAAAISRSDYKSQQDYLTAVNNAKAKVNNDRTSLQGTIVQTDLRNLAFEHDIQQIGDQQYIDGLKRILQMKHLTTDTRQQILREIYNLEHQSGSLNLDVGNIKLPSVYQIRRAIGLGQRGQLPGAQGTTINHTAVVNVYVNNRSDVPHVGAAIDHHLGTSVRSAMRARGV